MEQVENQSSEEAVAPPETEATHEQAPADEQPNDYREDKEWLKNLRKERNDLKRKAEMQEELLQRLMSQQQAPVQQQAPEPDEDLISDLQKEDYVPGEKVARVLKKQEEKFGRRIAEIEHRQEQNKQSALLSDLKRKYADYDDVVTRDTLQILEETEPDLAIMLAKDGERDPYKFAVQSYKYIKALGLSDKVPGLKKGREVEQRIEQNKKTVQSPAAFDKRPMAQAFKPPESKEEKQKLYAEMSHYASMSGGGY